MSHMLTEAFSPAENSRQDYQPPEKHETMTTPDTASRSTIVLERGHSVPDHLMDLLNDWHRENPTLQPPGAYRNKRPPGPAAVFSRTGERLHLSVIVVLAPVRYEMLVLQSEQDPAKFVGCIQDGPVRTFFKEWLGKNKFEDRACAVRLFIQKNGQHELPTEVMWKVADSRQPARKPPNNGSAVISTRRRRDRRDRFSDSDDDTDTTFTTQSSSEDSDNELSSHPTKRRRATETRNQPSVQNDNPMATVIFKLVTPKSSATRCFTVQASDTGEYLLKKSREFFRLFDRDISMPILVCKTIGDKEHKYIFDANDMDLLLKELRKRVREES